MGGKVKYHQLSEFEKKKYLGEFYDMIALLRSREEAKNFFKDLLSLSEVVMLSRRVQIAKMLLGGFGYDDIAKNLRVGKTTVNSVEKWLNAGFGGYKEILKRHKKKNARFDKPPSAPFSLGHIRRKYPLHFLLLNLLEKK